jgi:hypothetical protein
MTFRTLDPMLDTRWGEFAAIHPKSSIFHQQGWLNALAQTYGYKPMVLTSAQGDGQLSDGIVFCGISSWMTGKRLVSLPFADHCEPLTEGIYEDRLLTEWMGAERVRSGWQYFELRPVLWPAEAESALKADRSFWLHTLDLSPSLAKLFSGLHKNCVQRRIRRAEHAGLSYERGHSEALIDDFYRLLMMTRRRQSLIPQPRSWFRNLVACMYPAADIRLLRLGNVPIASILTLSHRRTVVYKYGCSDETYHHLGGMPWLFWKLIEESKSAGAEQIDFGRTDLDNAGLIQFKDRLGASRRLLTYLRFPESACGKSAVNSFLPAAKRVFSILPDALSARIGGLLYRHIG